MFHKSFLLWVILIFFCISNVLPQSSQERSINLSPDVSIYHLKASDIHWYEDRTNSLSFEEIIQKSKVFSAPPQLNMGQSANTHWIKLNINLTKPIHDKILLEFACRLDHLTFFYQKDNRWLSKKIGFQESEFEDRDIKYFHYVLPILDRQETTSTIYFKIKSNKLIKFHIILHHTKAFISHATKITGIHGIFYGIGIIMILYNLSLFVGLRDVNYVNYSVLISMSLLCISILDGNYVYLLPHIGFWFKYSSQIITLFLCSGIWFVLHFLNLRSTYRQCHQVLWAVLCINITYILLSFFMSPIWVTKIAIYLTLVNIVVIWLVCVMAWYRGINLARFLVISWSLYILSGVLQSMISLGMGLNTSWFVRHLLHFGFVSEVIFLSLAMVDRVRFLKLETEKAQQLALTKSQENVQLIHSQKEILSRKVKEKTQELQKSNDDLVVSNEELQQTHEELTVQRDLLALNNQELSEYKRRIGKSIEAAQTIQHAILPIPKLFNDYFADHFIIYQPKDIVSGDFYWIGSCAGKIILIEVDCTGHGVPGAFMTLVVYSLLNQIILQENHTFPSKIMSELHQNIYQYLQQETKKSAEGVDMSILQLQQQSSELWNVIFGASGQSFYYNDLQKKIHKIKGSRRRIGGFATIKNNLKYEEQTDRKSVV